MVAAFSEAVASFSRDTPSVRVTGSTVSSVQAHTEDGLENAWIFFLTPDGSGDVTFALVADAACASGGICTAGGTLLTRVPAALTIPGPGDAAETNTPTTGAPAISGTAQVDETLTASVSDISDADGLDNAELRLPVDPRERRPRGRDRLQLTPWRAPTRARRSRVRVSFTDDAGNAESLTSEATDTVAAAPNTPATGAPTISGTAQVDETLTASVSDISDADGLDDASFAYQWIRG